MNAHTAVSIALQIFEPVFFAVASAAVATLTKFTVDHIKNVRAQGALLELEKVAEGAVADIYQSTVASLKNGTGGWSSATAQAAKQAAIDAVHKASPRAIAILKAHGGDIEAIVGQLIEKAVVGLKGKVS